MAEVDEVFEQYKGLRSGGAESKDALRQIRPHVESLTREQKDQLAAAIRGFESAKIKRTTQTIKPLQPLKSDSKPIAQDIPKPPQVTPTPSKPDRIICWNCGTPNRPGEMLCVSCGKLLMQGTTEEGSTRQLKVDEVPYDVFRASSMLYLRVRHNGTILKISPQEYDHEVIVGRADNKGIVKPDIDLSPHGAAGMGVSRMHMSLIYDQVKNQIRISDMGSVNGLYVNGQKLVPMEVRVLRHGDQLRLGDFVLDVAYKHGE